MSNTPMVIHLYGEDNEVTKTVTRSFVPWKLLKEAVKIASHLKPDEMGDEDVDALAGLVVAIFGDQFTVEELNNSADISEMIAVLNQIVSKASSGMANPIQPG